MEDKDVFEGIKWVMKNGYVKGKTFGGSYDITKQTGYLYFLREIPGPGKIPQIVMTEIKWEGSSPNKYKLTNTPLSEEEVKELKDEHKKSKKMKDGGEVTTYKVGKHGKEQRMLLKQLLDSLNTKITKEESASGILGFNANGIPVYIKQDPVYLEKRVFSSAGNKGPNYTLIEEESPEGIRYVFKEGNNKKIFTNIKEFPYGELPFLQAGTGEGGIQSTTKDYSAKQIIGAGLMNTFSNIGTPASQTSNANLVQDNATNNTVVNPVQQSTSQLQQSTSQLNTHNATQRRLQMLQQDEINNAKRLNLKSFNSSTTDINDYNNSIQKKQNLHNDVRQIKENNKNNAIQAMTTLGNKITGTLGNFAAGAIGGAVGISADNVKEAMNATPAKTSGKGSKISYKTLF